MIDIREENGKIIVSIEVPEVNEKDIKIKVEEDNIEVRANRRIKKLQRRGFEDCDVQS